MTLTFLRKLWLVLPGPSSFSSSDLFFKRKLYCLLRDGKQMVANTHVNLPSLALKPLIPLFREYWFDHCGLSR